MSCAILLGLLAFPATAPAQDYALPDPQAAAEAALPEYDPDARLEGKSAVEHAEDLGDPTLMRRLMALQALIDMGPDALPAREVVRFVVEHDGAGFTDVQLDDLRMGALSALHAMQAPETEDLLREKIMDPEFVSRDRSYAGLLGAAAQVGIDEGTLARDVVSLVATERDHAVRLMLLEELPAEAQLALEQAVLEGSHGDRVARYMLDRLPELTFLDDAERLAYAVEHLDSAGQGQRHSREVLAGIGTEAALDAALEMIPLEGISRAQIIAGFVEGPMAEAYLTDRLIGEIGATEGEQDISHGVSTLERMLRDDSTGLFSQAMAALLENGPTALHRSVAAQRQALHVMRNSNVDTAEALRPVFALAGDETAAPEARIAAASALGQFPTRLAEGDPEFFISEAVALIWPAAGPAEAELPLALLMPLMSSDDHAPRVVDAIDAGYEAHLTDWSINPATAIAIASGTTRGLERSPTRETAAIMMGRVIKSPAVDLGYLGPHLGRNGAALADLERNTVAGVIGTYEPTIFAEDKPSSYDFAMEPYMRPMLVRPARFAQDQEAKAEWIAFLERVVNLDDENFSPYAVRALEAL